MKKVASLELKIIIMKNLIVLALMFSVFSYSQNKKDSIRTINIDEIELKNYSNYSTYFPLIKKSKYENFIVFNSGTSVISESDLKIRKRSKLIAIEFELNSKNETQESETPLLFMPILVINNENIKNNLFNSISYNYYTSDYIKKILIDVSKYNIFLDSDKEYYFGIKYISDNNLNKSIKLNMVLSKRSKTYHCIKDDKCLSIGKVNEEYGVSLKYKIYVDEKVN